MNQFSNPYIRNLNKQQNFPTNLIDKECLFYKDLIFEEDDKKNKLSIINNKLSECFIIENVIKEDENKNTLKRAWVGNENNKKTSIYIIAFSISNKLLHIINHIIFL